ncbi:MAG: hypothetical protein K1X75_00660 [Leptospirales bacterium]|nr:hypothetical protein [Leptospirales bacterium]
MPSTQPRLRRSTERSLEALRARARQWRPLAASARRVRSAALSFLFALAVIGVYYALRWLIPAELALYDQIVTVAFIIISTLILFPARERALALAVGRDEFSRFFGRDFHHLDFMAQPRSMEEMIHESFPAFMEWLGVKHARMAVLEPGRRSYRFHVYRNGILLKSRHIAPRGADELLRALKAHGAIDIQDRSLSPGALKRLTEMGAVSAHGFRFRGRLLGFLALHDVVRNRFAPRALEFFCAKAGISVQNHIYSYRIIDSRLYDQEFSAAAKVQSILHNPPLPEIPGLLLRRPAQKEYDSILEFFQAADDRWYVIAIACEQMTMSAALELYAVIGRLYSVLQREENLNLHRLLGHLKKSLEEEAADYPLFSFAAELSPGRKIMVAMLEKGAFQIREVAEPTRALATPGWRNFIDLESNKTYRLSYRERPLLELRLAAGETQRTTHP